MEGKHPIFRKGHVALRKLYELDAYPKRAKPKELLEAYISELEEYENAKTLIRKEEELSDISLMRYYIRKHPKAAVSLSKLPIPKGTTYSYGWYYLKDDDKERAFIRYTYKHFVRRYGRAIGIPWEITKKLQNHYGVFSLDVAHILTLYYQHDILGAYVDFLEISNKHKWTGSFINISTQYNNYERRKII